MKRSDKNGLTRGMAKYLYVEHRLGAEYLVKDRDGRCYIVDHGAGELYKYGGCWKDRLGDREDSFQESKYDFEIVSWKDKEPLELYEYLKDNGWWDEFEQFY